MAQQWKYDRKIIPESQFTQTLTQLGAQGWEVYQQREFLNETTNERQYEVFLKKPEDDNPQLLKS